MTERSETGHCIHCGAHEIEECLPNAIRMHPSTGDHGTLHDYQTGDCIRPATEHEAAASSVAADYDGGTGVIDVDGRSCYVQE